jgi:hypothetical protein
MGAGGEGGPIPPFQTSTSEGVEGGGPKVKVNINDEDLD